MKQDSFNSATLQIQPANGRGERRTIPITFQTFASKCLTLTTSEPLAISTAVGVEYNDVLFVGEVVRCTTAAGDQWEIDVRVAQTLTGLQSLLILRAQLDQRQAQSKDAPTDEPIPCAVLSTGKNKPAKKLERQQV